MQKKSLVFGFSAILGLFLINFVSAQYGGSIFKNIIYYLDPLMLLFFIFFGFMFFAWSKFFRGNALLAAVVSGAASLLAIYGIDRYGFDYEGLFYNIFFFIPEDILYTFLPLVILAAIGFSIYKLKLGLTLIIIGAFFSFASFFGYEAGVSMLSMFIGITLILLGLGWLLWRKKKPGIGSYPTPTGYRKYPPSGPGLLRRGVRNIGSGTVKASKWTGQKTWEGTKLASRKTFDASKAAAAKAQQKWQERKQKEEFLQQRKIQENIKELEKRKQEFKDYIDSVLKSTKGQIPSKDNYLYAGWKKARDSIVKIEDEIKKLRRY